MGVRRAAEASALVRGPRKYCISVGRAQRTSARRTGRARWCAESHDSASSKQNDRSHSDALLALDPRSGSDSAVVLTAAVVPNCAPTASLTILSTPPPSDVPAGACSDGASEHRRSLNEQPLWYPNPLGSTCAAASSTSHHPLALSAANVMLPNTTSTASYESASPLNVRPSRYDPPMAP